MHRDQESWRAAALHWISEKEHIRAAAITIAQENVSVDPRKLLYMRRGYELLTMCYPLWALIVDMQRAIYGCDEFVNILNTFDAYLKGDVLSEFIFWAFRV
jgi:hypothetical protein